MSGRVKVYYFSQKLEPIMSTEQEIVADSWSLARAVRMGMYAIDDTCKKPQPLKYETRLLRDEWQDSPVQKRGRFWTVEHEGALTFVPLSVANAIFKQTITHAEQRAFDVGTVLGEIG